MIREMSRGIQSDLLEKVRASNTNISCSITKVRLEKVGATLLEIKPREVGTDSEGWSVGKEDILFASKDAHRNRRNTRTRRS